ncbi:hypothetical protein ACFL5A_02680 [Gemmatimonadota bacterium]
MPTNRAASLTMPTLLFRTWTYRIAVTLPDALAPMRSLATSRFQ